MKNISSDWIMEFIRNPKSIASIAPSSSRLGAKISEAAIFGLNNQKNLHDIKIIELGPGNGSITNELISAGFLESNIVAFETNPKFANFMRSCFPLVRTLNTDARYVDYAVKDFGLPKPHLIISSLGFKSMTSRVISDICHSCNNVMTKDSVFVQFTYGFHDPIPQEIQDSLNWNSSHFANVFMNLPPASVFIYKKL